MLGEAGVQLSIGEKQRLAIARVLLKNTPIILFDEVTSALDAYTEKCINQTIEEISKDHTVIIITHRLEIVEKINSVLYIEKGKIVEYGNHKELLKGSSKYEDLWNGDRDKKGVYVQERTSEVEQTKLIY